MYSPRYNQQRRRVDRKSTGNTPSVFLRLSHLRLLIMVVGVVLIGRLFHLQIIRHNHYSGLAKAEHQKKFTLPATRGSLYFRDGENAVPAVLNDTVYTLYVDPTIVTDKQVVADLITDSIDISRPAVLKQLNRKNTAYAVLTKRLTKNQVDKLFKHKEKLKGVGVTPVQQRVYPEGALAGQILGFVNADGVGQYGVEGYLNDKLSGKEGTLEAVTDVHGIPLSLDDSRTVAVQPENGKNYILTIDRNVQSIAETALRRGIRRSQATKGSVVVLDPNTGAIRAMANMPTYNPAQYHKVTDNAYERFQNRVVSNPYEPGSVIKVLTMGAGLDTGSVSLNSTYYNSGSMTVGDAEITNVNKTVVGRRSMTEVLKFSLNTGVTHILGQMGGGSINRTARERLHKYFVDRYRLGRLTGVEQVGESAGTIAGTNTGAGDNIRYANMAFGQGMNVTMLQVAAGFSAMLNGGNYYTPFLVEGEMSDNEQVLSKPAKPAKKGVVKPSTSKQIMLMMRQSFEETPTVSRVVRPGYNVAGKSGTSETIDPRTGKYTTDRVIGSYLGYGGDQRLKYVIMVRIDDSKIHAFGSESAAPIFGEISNQLIDYYNVKSDR